MVLPFQTVGVLFFKPSMANIALRDMDIATGDVCMYMSYLLL
jgi:hypothetical protein